MSPPDRRTYDAVLRQRGGPGRGVQVGDLPQRVPVIPILPKDLDEALLIHINSVGHYCAPG